MNLETLKQHIPQYAQTLGKMLVHNAIPSMQSTGQTLEDMTPAVSLIIKPTDGSPPFRITLSVGTGEETTIPASEG